MTPPKFAINSSFDWLRNQLFLPFENLRRLRLRLSTYWSARNSAQEPTLRRSPRLGTRRFSEVCQPTGKGKRAKSLRV